MFKALSEAQAYFWYYYLMINIKLRSSSIIIQIRKLPTPINITIWWNWGRLLGLILVIQITTGLFLAIHYTANVDLAFESVRHIVRDVNAGWMIRTLHANGASFFFVCLYAHVGRGLYYGRYTYKGTWVTGIILLLLVIASAFLGYVLPWGQISFWGATVITNLFRAVPYFGQDLVIWIWGGFSVNNATLTRFFTFHFITPIIVAFTVVIHILLLHRTGRNNPLGVNSSSDKVPFHWYFTIKDVVGFIVFLFILLRFVIFIPNLLGEPDNFIIANPIVTPAHIVPEWYFLFAYAILRAIPRKFGGVLGLFSSLLLLLTLPFIVKRTLKRNSFYPIGKLNHWIFVMCFVILTLGGAWPVESPYIETRRLFAVGYFSFFLFVYPFRYCTDTLVM